MNENYVVAPDGEIKINPVQEGMEVISGDLRVERVWHELSPEEQRDVLDVQRLAYMDEVPVNWCPGLGTVLANEEVIDGKSERGNYPVERRPLRQWLMHDDHLQPKVDYDIADVDAGHRRVTFRVQPGPRYQQVLLAFEGASAIDPDQLDKIVAQQKLERQLFTDPVVVTRLLRRYYREQGFMAAEIDEPRLEFQGTTARVVLAVREGPRFVVGKVTTAGNSVYPTDLLVSELPVVSGEDETRKQIVLYSVALEGSHWQGHSSRTVSHLEDGGRKLIHQQFNQGPDGKEHVLMELVLTKK